MSDRVQEVKHTPECKSTSKLFGCLKQRDNQSKDKHLPPSIPSLPPDNFTRTPLSINFARSRAFSFRDILRLGAKFVFHCCWVPIFGTHCQRIKSGVKQLRLKQDMPFPHKSKWAVQPTPAWFAQHSDLEKRHHTGWILFIIQTLKIQRSLVTCSVCLEYFSQFSA